MASPLQKSETESWWYRLVYADDVTWAELIQRQCEHWLRYTKVARLLYASFWEQRDENKITSLRLRNTAEDRLISECPIRAEFSPIVIHLLRLFLPQLPEQELTRACRLHQVADDRMFVQVAYALDGPVPRTGTPEMDQFERLFSYALFVDQRTDGYAAAGGWAYDEVFTRTLMDEECLRRWQAIGTLSGFTRASSVFMGSDPSYYLLLVLTPLIS